MVNQSIVTAGVVGLGTGNLNTNPQFVNAATGDLHLKNSSPAIGVGPNGLDIGAYVNRWAAISGEPAAQTGLTSASINIGGPGIVAYKYKLVTNGVPDANFGAEIPVGTPITLSGLANGSYAVQVIGKNAAGVYQDSLSPTVSKTWTVTANLSRLFINEVLASNNSASAPAARSPMPSSSTTAAPRRSI